MVSVQQAEQIITETAASFGVETLPFEQCVGRVLAEDLKADRDLPPYDRVMMDGIAISFSGIEEGFNSFTVEGIQAAGDDPLTLSSAGACVEIMTGAVLPGLADTIIRYEDLRLEKGMAFLLVDNIFRGQNVHRRGQDRQSGVVVAKAGSLITPAVISMAASVGASKLTVQKLPRVLIVSSGDEVVDVNETPQPFQIRRSNSYAVSAALQRFGITAELLHLPDDLSKTEEALRDALNNYEVILLSGGISMGKFDHIPAALETIGVRKLFHKVQQKPGKPFWFGRHSNGTTVFAFPGNPVATFLCTYRYLLPWLASCFKIISPAPVFAKLKEHVSFAPAMQFFIPVKLAPNQAGELYADKVDNNNSGDFSGLVDADAFIELPAEEMDFYPGKAYRVWPF